MDKLNRSRSNNTNHTQHWWATLTMMVMMLERSTIKKKKKTHEKTSKEINTSNTSKPLGRIMDGWMRMRSVVCAGELVVGVGVGVGDEEELVHKSSKPTSDQRPGPVYPVVGPGPAHQGWPK